MDQLNQFLIQKQAWQERWNQIVRASGGRLTPQQMQQLTYEQQAMIPIEERLRAAASTTQSSLQAAANQQNMTGTVQPPLGQRLPPGPPQPTQIKTPVPVGPVLGTTGAASLAGGEQKPNVPPVYYGNFGKPTPYQVPQGNRSKPNPNRGGWVPSPNRRGW